MGNIVKKSSGRLLYYFYTPDGILVDPDTISCLVEKEDGTFTVSRQPVKIGDGIYALHLNPSDTERIGRYKATWTVIEGDFTLTDTEYFDVVSTEDEYLVNVDEVKEFLQITDTSLDNFIRFQILNFQQIAEKYCRRIFKPAFYENEKYDGNGEDELLLKHFPIMYISILKIGDTTIPMRFTPDSSGFDFEKIIGIVKLTGYVFEEGKLNVWVNYAAGLDPIPRDLKQAVMEWVAIKIKRRDSAGIVSERLGSYSVTYSEDEIPGNIVSILNRYRSVCL